jgi:hypothetical protein
MDSKNLRYQLNYCVFSWLLPAEAAELLTVVFRDVFQKRKP